MLTVIVTNMTITDRSVGSTNSYVTITGGLYAVLTFIVTITAITGRSIESVNNYFDNKVEGLYVMRSMCSANSYCDNNDSNGEVCMQC